MTTAELEALLTAHADLRVERPPVLWAPLAELEPLTRMLREMISAGLVRNNGLLGELTLNVSNVTVERDAAGWIPEGEFVAVTIRGKGDWAPETTWTRSEEADSILESVQLAAAAAGASCLYSRVLDGGEGSVTVLLPRQSQGSSGPTKSWAVVERRALTDLDLVE
jgi:hypothetical protein